MVALRRVGTRVFLVCEFEFEFGQTVGWLKRERGKTQRKRGDRKLYFFGVVETDLSRGHGCCFAEVGPWSVDYVDVVLFVS